MGVLIAILSAIPGLGTLVRVFFPSADKQLGRAEQKMDDGAAITKEVIDAKSTDNAVGKLADGSALEQLRQQFGRPD